MHELSLAFDLVDRIQSIAVNEKVKSVDKVFITIGELSGIDPDSFLFAFPEAAKETLASQAKLFISITPDHEFQFNRMEVSDV
ncbi:MAG: hypothetical protein Fur0010_20240 [Bdellovibrio sp.]